MQFAEYSKRLSRYCKLDIIEVADEKTPENASDTVENQIRKKGSRAHSDAYWIRRQKRAHMYLPLQSTAGNLIRWSYQKRLKILGLPGSARSFF